MKKIIFSFSIFMAGLLVLPSCSKDYLETAPTDAVSSSTVFTTTANALAALNGMYRAMYIQYSNQDEGGEGSVMIDMDVMGEDVVFNSASGYVAQMRYITNRTITSAHLYFVYRYYYKLISNANAIIEGIDGATGATADKNQIKGEALAMRAYAHFKLVQMFGKRYNALAKPNVQLGVPLNLTTKVDPLPRATVEEVYTQVNADLDAAMVLLTSATARVGLSHININVARGIKARVALAQQDYATAATMASAAIAGVAGVNSLMSGTQYFQGFNSVTNPEWIWGIRHQSDQPLYFYDFFAYMSANFGSSNIRSNPKSINNKLYNQISATDIRKGLWDPTGSNTAFPVPSAPSGTRFPYMHRKFLAVSTDSANDLPLMRLSELYLIVAEANARIGKDTDAQNALFTLAKQRDPNYVKSVSTGATLAEEVMIQRRIELWGEGFRYGDLKRLNLALDRTGSNHTATIATVLTLAPGDVRWEWLFPQTETNSNSLIVQNPL